MSRQERRRAVGGSRGARLARARHRPDHARSLQADERRRVPDAVGAGRGALRRRAARALHAQRRHARGRGCRRPLRVPRSAGVPDESGRPGGRAAHGARLRTTGAGASARCRRDAECWRSRGDAARVGDDGRRRHGDGQRPGVRSRHAARPDRRQVFASAATGRRERHRHPRRAERRRRPSSGFTAPAAPKWADVQPILTQTTRCSRRWRRSSTSAPATVTANKATSAAAAAARRPGHMPVTRDLSAKKRAMIVA